MSEDKLPTYQGELTLEALATLDVYIKTLCNKRATARKLKKAYQRIFLFLKQPYVRELFKLKLLEKGVTPDKVAETINTGLEAANGIYFDGNKISDEPNWSARQKFSQLAAEMFEVLKYNVRVDSQSTTTNIINSFNQLTDEELIEQARKRGIRISDDITRRIDAAQRVKRDEVVSTDRQAERVY